MLLLLTSCGHPTTAERLVPVTTLPLGKSDLVLDSGVYRAPDGFVPDLTFRQVKGWHSTHRGADAFDVGLPDPAKDAPLVVIVFAHLKGTPEQVVADLRRRQRKALVDPLVQVLAGHNATQVDVVDGDGSAFAAGGIELDVSPETHLRVYVASIDGATLAAAVLLPQARFGELFPVAYTVLDSAWVGPSPTPCCRM